MEHKVFIGFESAEAARLAFIRMYSIQTLGNIDEVPIDEYRWRTSARLTDSIEDAFNESEHPRKSGGEGGGQFTRGSGGGSSSTGSGKSSSIVLKPVRQRAFPGKSVELKTHVSKLETGQLGES